MSQFHSGHTPFSDANKGLPFVSAEEIQQKIISPSGGVVTMPCQELTVISESANNLRLQLMFCQRINSQKYFNEIVTDTTAGTSMFGLYRESATDQPEFKLARFCRSGICTGVSDIVEADMMFLSEQLGPVDAEPSIVDLSRSEIEKVVLSARNEHDVDINGTSFRHNPDRESVTWILNIGEEQLTFQIRMFEPDRMYHLECMTGRVLLEGFEQERTDCAQLSDLQLLRVAEKELLSWGQQLASYLNG